MPGKAPPKIDAQRLRDYFEVLTKAVFHHGTSWAVVEARWGGVTSGLAGFDPHVVSGFTPESVDRLMQDARMVRNRRKIEATIENAAEMIALDREHGGFARYLESHESFDDLVADLTARFRCLEESGACFFLQVVGMDVPAEQARLALR